MPQPRDDNHRSSNDAVRIVQRRMKVTMLMLDGIYSTNQLLLKMGMDPSQRMTISRDKKWVLMVWRKATEKNVCVVKAKLVASLWHNYQQAMEAWHKSKDGKEVEQTTTGKVDGTMYKIEGCAGDTSCLANARAALVEIGKLHGLYTEKMEAQIIRQLEGWEPILEELNEEELAVLEILNRRMKMIEGGKSESAPQ
jgi:hypothetical protein